jgi:NADH dehydrogenase
VVGAGFGGLAAARRLARAPVDVLVVDRTNHHLFQPLLYQVATGILAPGEIAPPIRGIFRRDLRTSVLLAEVTGLDLGRREVLARGVDGTPHRLGYDYLVVAAGARDSYFGHEDWARHLFPMKTLVQAVALRDRILAAYEQAAQASDDQAWWTTFVIVGAGPTGVELAGQLATIARQFHRDFRRIDTERARIVVVEAGPQILPAFARPLREHAGRKLAAMGVQIRLGCEAVHVDEDGIDIRTRDGGRERIRARTVVWAAGVEASPLGRLLGEATGAAVDRKGRVAVGPDCTLPGHPEVFAIGDVAALDDLPGLCEPAMQEGWYVARLIRSRLAGDPPPGPFRYRDLGTMATISPGDAVAEAFGLHLTGVAGKLAWAFVHIAFLAGWGNRAGVLSRWGYDMATRSRSERVILEGVGDMAGLAEVGRGDEPALTGNDSP